MVVFSSAFLLLFLFSCCFAPFVHNFCRHAGHVTYHRTESVHINSIQRRHRINLALLPLWPESISPDSTLTVERAREFTRVTQIPKGSWKSAHWLLQAENCRFGRAKGVSPGQRISTDFGTLSNSCSSHPPCDSSSRRTADSRYANPPIHRMPALPRDFQVNLWPKETTSTPKMKLIGIAFSMDSHTHITGDVWRVSRGVT